jgi:hypothetical protein
VNVNERKTSEFVIYRLKKPAFFFKKAAKKAAIFLQNQQGFFQNKLFLTKYQALISD